jgi:hypothetical protein
MEVEGEGEEEEEVEVEAMQKGDGMGTEGDRAIVDAGVQTQGPDLGQKPLEEEVGRAVQTECIV